jgi:hypothetical protein
VAWEWTNWQEWNTLEHWPVDLPKAKHDKAWFRVSSMAYWTIASQLFFFLKAAFAILEPSVPNSRAQKLT